MAVPAIKHLQGTLEYNGFTFPGTVKTRMQVQPVQDSTGRYTKHVLYTLTVECIVWPGVDSLNPGQSIEPEEPDTDPEATFPSTDLTTDGGMETTRHLLSENGKRLVFIGKGFGDDFTIDTGETSDVSYGPKVQVLTWAPVASNNSAVLVWSVEVAIANCDIVALGRIAEYSYEQDYSIDVNGLTTRTITGFIQISNQISNGRTLHNVDTYRDQLAFWPPTGFQRVRQNWRVSADGSRLSWTLVDRQLATEIEPIAGITDHSIRQRITSVGPVPGVSWAVSINGTIDVAKGYSKWQAWTFFMMFVNSRLKAIRGGVASDEDGNPVSKSFAMPTRVELEDEITGLTFGASAAWLLTIRGTVREGYESVIRDTGLFQDVDTGASWPGYRTAMTRDAPAGAWSPRGNIKLRPNNKRVITLCDNANGAGTVVDAQNEPFKATYTTIFSGDKCDEHYFTFDPMVTQVTDTNTVTIQSTVGKADQNNVPGDIIVKVSAAQQDKIVHQRAGASTRLVFSGVANRVGSPIPIPKLKEYGGVKDGNLVIVGEPTFDQRTSVVNGCKVWHARWQIIYDMLEEPSGTEFVTDPNILIPLPSARLRT